MLSVKKLVEELDRHSPMVTNRIAVVPDSWRKLVLCVSGSPERKASGPHPHVCSAPVPPHPSVLQTPADARSVRVCPQECVMEPFNRLQEQHQRRRHTLLDPLCEMNQCTPLHLFFYYRELFFFLLLYKIGGVFGRRFQRSWCHTLRRTRGRQCVMRAPPESEPFPAACFQTQARYGSGGCVCRFVSVGCRLVRGEAVAGDADRGPAEAAPPAAVRGSAAAPAETPADLDAEGRALQTRATAPPLCSRHMDESGESLCLIQPRVRVCSLTLLQDLNLTMYGRLP